MANMASYNALKKALGFKSVVSVRDYVGFLEEAFLVFEIFKYDYSLKKQYVNDKKIYVIDNGMRNAVAFQFSDDRGRLLENCVFIELLRRNAPVYFFKITGECDFVTEDHGKVTAALQVCYELSQKNGTGTRWSYQRDAHPGNKKWYHSHVSPGRDHRP